MDLLEIELCKLISHGRMLFHVPISKDIVKAGKLVEYHFIGGAEVINYNWN